MESTSIGPHLHDDPLDDETQKIINRIADGLPDRDWEEHEEGKITAVKDVSNIRNDMIEVKESFKIKSKCAFGILHYKQSGPSPYNPSDRFRIIIPLKLERGSRPKVKDKDLTYGRMIYTIQSEEITAGVTILWLRIPGDVEN